MRKPRRDSMVSALTAEGLNSQSERNAEFARLDDQQQRIQIQIERFSASNRLDREVLHARADILMK